MAQNLTIELKTTNGRLVASWDIVAFADDSTGYYFKDKQVFAIANPTAAEKVVIDKIDNLCCESQ